LPKRSHLCMAIQRPPFVSKHTFEQEGDSEQLLLCILLAITGMLGPYVLLTAMLHPIQTLKVLAGETRPRYGKDQFERPLDRHRTAFLKGFEERLNAEPARQDA
jgi:hypothetical protein